MASAEARRNTVNVPQPRSAAGETFNDVLMLVLRLHGSFTAAGEAVAKPAGQTLARWVLLDQCRDAPVTVSEIARQLRQARQSAQRVADLLVADGLCTYQDNPHHQRAKLLALTPAGRAALYAIDDAQHQWCDSLGSKIGAPELRRTATALRRITDTVENTPPTPRP